VGFSFAKRFRGLVALMLISFIFSSLFPTASFADKWVKGYAKTKEVWVDTSHWETRKKWVDTSHWETYWTSWEYHRSYARKFFGYELSFLPSDGGAMKACWFFGVNFVYDGLKKWKYYYYSNRKLKRLWTLHRTPVRRYYIFNDHKWWTDSPGYYISRKVRRFVKSGYWKYYRVWVVSGHWAPPIRGTVTIKKSPTYVFTKWHRDSRGRVSHLDIEVSWNTSKPISRLTASMVVNRYRGKGKDHIFVFDRKIIPSKSGRVKGRVEFEHAGDEKSTLYVRLKASDGTTALVYCSIPINGFLGINVNSSASSIPVEPWKKSLQDVGSVRL